MTRRKKDRPERLVTLRETHGVTPPDAESRLIAAELLAVLAKSTTPLRWKTFRSYAFGVSVHDIARREGVPRATIYNRIRLARRDFAAALARLK